MVTTSAHEEEDFNHASPLVPEKGLGELVSNPHSAPERVAGARNLAEVPSRTYAKIPDQRVDVKILNEVRGRTHDKISIQST